MTSKQLDSQNKCELSNKAWPMYEVPGSYPLIWEIVEHPIILCLEKTRRLHIQQAHCSH